MFFLRKISSSIFLHAHYFYELPQSLFVLFLCIYALLKDFFFYFFKHTAPETSFSNTQRKQSYYDEDDHEDP